MVDGLRKCRPRLDDGSRVEAWEGIVLKAAHPVPVGEEEDPFDVE